MPQIHVNRLKQIIREEMKLMREGEDHDSAAKLMSSATKLLSAIEAFKESASERARSSLAEVGLEQVEQTLKRVIESPMQYVDATKPAAKKVTLKPQTEKML